jgi:outer membrane murein-binding lipoprotein Lpp
MLIRINNKLNKIAIVQVNHKVVNMATNVQAINMDNAQAKKNADKNRKAGKSRLFYRIGLN